MLFLFLLQMMARRWLSDKEIDELLLQDDGSDCESCFSDDSVQDPNWDRSDSSDDELILPNESKASDQIRNDQTSISLCAGPKDKELKERMIVISESHALHNIFSIVQHRGPDY